MKATNKQKVHLLKLKEYALIIGFWIIFLNNATAQHVITLGKYHANKESDWPVLYRHSATFNSLEDAILHHKEILNLNGIDTSLTSVEFELDTPIFSSYLHQDVEDLAIVTYVKKVSNRKYISCFLECENVTFELFESDGFILTQKEIEE